MTRAEKLDLIAKFETAYSAVEEQIVGLSREALLFVPPIEDAWSINDFLVHFLDADANLNLRMRGAIAEPGIAVPGWDEEAWHARLHYDTQDGRKCLELAKAIRGFLAESLRAVVDEDWGAFHFLHSVRGKTELAALLATYREHVAFHLGLIRRNKEAWKNQAT